MAVQKKSRNSGSLIKRWKNFNSKPTPHWLQTWSQIASVILAILAIILTIKFANQKQQIQDFDKVLNELVVQNGNLDSMNRLQNLQLKAMISNTQPNLIITGLFDLKKIDRGRYVYRVQYQNNGVRAATNFQAATAYAYMDEKDSTFLLYKISDILNTTVPAGQTGIFIDTINVNRETHPFNNVFMKQMLSCVDPFTNNEILFDPVYYTHLPNDDKILSTRFANNKEKEKIDKLISSRDLSKDIKQ